MDLEGHTANEATERQFGRLKLGIPATLETLHGRKYVRMVDLSQGGALLVLPQAFEIRDCVVRWLAFEVFASSVWQRGPHLGLEFEKPLPLNHILTTRAYAPDLIAEAERAVSAAARGWADGWYASGVER